MALVATCAELAVVQIVDSMAGDTVTTQRCGRLAFWRHLFVTGFATNFEVLAIQAVLGLLVMIEIPQSPGPGVVAAFTQRTKRLLVFVFLHVTAQAITRRILVTRTLVATLASSRYMAPRQRETCQPMVKLFNFP